MANTAIGDHPPPLLHEVHDDSDTEADPLLESALRRGSTHRSGDRLAATVATVSVAALAVFTWLLILTHDPFKLSWFSFHPPLQTAAICCFVFGIMAPQRTTLDDPEEKEKGLVFHQWWIVLFALPSIIAGTSFMLYNKTAHGAEHFTTWHAKFGIATFILILLQAAVGAGSVWFGGAAFGGGDKAKAVYKYHRISGYTILTLMMVTLYLAGNWADWMVKVTSLPTRIIFYTVLPALILLSVGIRIRFYKMKFW